MNVQGPYSEFRYNINVPLSFMQQQRAGETRNTTTRGIYYSGNSNTEPMTSVVSPLLALPLPPSTTTVDDSSNNHTLTRDGRRRNDNNNNDNHSDSGTFAAASMSRAIRNRVTTSRDEAFTMYRRAAAGSNGLLSNNGGTTVLPLHNATPSTHSPHINSNMITIQSSLGSDRDFVYGFIFGSMVGSGMLLWIWIPTVSYKQKIGILFGYALHITMNMIHKSLHPDDHNVFSPDDIHSNEYHYSKNFLINDDTLQLGE